MSIKNSLIALGVLALLIITAMGVNWWKERQLLKENTLRVEAEMRIKQSIAEQVRIKKDLDSVKTVIKNKEELINFLENNPKVIIRKNDDSHLSIDKLNAYNSILRFTANVAKYDSLRKGRYDLHRFDKHN